MFVNPGISRTIGRILLASALCVLTFAFAMEAKMAWYGPGAGLKSEITAAKAMPADMPRVMAHGLATPEPVAPQTYFFVLSFFIAAILLRAGFFYRLPMAPIAVEDVRHSFFSPFQFFRPPPVHI